MYGLYFAQFVQAPICEEYVFRSAILSLLVLGQFSFVFCCFASPFIFGIGMSMLIDSYAQSMQYHHLSHFLILSLTLSPSAHLHHLINLVRSRGLSISQGSMVVGFQLFYTTLFGSYASFIYLRTGHLLSAILIHTFCNLLGFPSLSWLRPQHILYDKRIVIGIGFVIGMILFGVGLFEMTDPALYDGWYWDYMQHVQSVHRVVM